MRALFLKHRWPRLIALLALACVASSGWATSKNQRIEKSTHGPLTEFPAARNQSVEFPPLAPGAYPVACSNLAHDVARLKQLGGSLDDYWSGSNDHYVGDILLEPASTLKTSQWCRTTICIQGGETLSSNLL